MSSAETYTTTSSRFPLRFPVVDSGAQTDFFYNVEEIEIQNYHPTQNCFLINTNYYNNL